MGKDTRKKQDGTGTYKDSFMAKSGRTGKKAGRKLGFC